MNKLSKVLSGIACMLFSFGSFAQVELGIETGLNISNVHVGGITDALTPNGNFITTFRPAITLAIPLDQHLSIVTGLANEVRGFDQFVGREVSFLGIDLPLGATVLTRIKYVEMPLNLRYNFTGNSKVRPFIQAGANLGYAYEGSIKTQINVILNFNINKTAINLESDAVNRLDVAPNLVAGVDIPYSSGYFTFSIGYERSVQNFLSDTVIGIETRHYGFTPSIGYKYAFSSSPSNKA